jgi:hypothetical protein
VDGGKVKKKDSPESYKGAKRRNGTAWNADGKCNKTTQKGGEEFDGSIKKKERETRRTVKIMFQLVFRFDFCTNQDDLWARSMSKQRR